MSSRTTTEPDAAAQTGHQPPATPGASTDPPGEAAPLTNVGQDRGEVIGSGLRSLAAWSLRFIIVLVAAGVLLWLVGQLWVGVFPVVMAVILTTVLWPAARLLRQWGWPDGLAAAVTMVVGLGLLTAIGVAIAPSIAEQSGQVVDRAGEGLVAVEEWLAGPPFNVDSSQLSDLVDRGREWVQGQAGGIASGLFVGVAAVGSAVVTTLLVLVLTFFFLKDGSAFLPWLRSFAGRRAGLHLTEVLSRVWNTVSGFIRTQALVGLIDAVFIAAGLLIFGVPLAFALAILTFFGAFIPVVGAFIAGALAVLVALVSNGPGTALAIFLIVLAVQQLEGNVLLPVLQSKSMDLHAGIVLLAITVGSTLFGIVGAFLAVPVAASTVVVLRYISEQVDLRTGDRDAARLPVATPDGAVLARQTQEEGRAERVSDVAAATPAPDRQAAGAQVELASEPGPTRASQRGAMPWWKALWRRLFKSG